MSNDDTITIDEATISWDASRVVFTQTPDWILNNPNINDAAFRTWMTIAMHASNKNHTAFPSARKLTDLRGKGRRVIFEHIRHLEAAGLLVREARYRANGGRTSSHYTLAWDRPLTPVQKSAPPPSAGDRTTPDAENRVAPRATNRATRTRTRTELDPLPPNDAPTNDVTEQASPQGATAPHTPRSPRKGRRQNGTNPRAVDARGAKELQMRQWARNMCGALSHEEFVELVKGEVATDQISSDLAEIAIAESCRLSTVQQADAGS